MSSARTEPLRLLTGSIRIYSPTTHESELAKYLLRSMRRLGYSNVRIDGAGNVLGEIGSGKPRLLLCGHMDTVPGELPLRMTRDTIYGRGAADAKSPLCALMLAGASSADSGVHVTFAGVTDEEGDGLGIGGIIRSRTRYDYAVFGEPGGASRITIGYRGRVSVHITIRTQGGHAGSPWAHRSAFDEFSSILLRLRDYERSRTDGDNHFNSLSISPTLVSAGTFHNVVPGLCEATLDLRIPPSIKASDAVNEVRAVASSNTTDARVEVRAGEATEPYLVDSGSKLVRAFQRAIILRLKAKPSFIRKTATGDMNTFAQKTGTQCLTYGPGFTKTSHTDKEAVQIRDYLNSIEVLKEAINQLGSLDSGVSR
jgi:LysW-gamma-L-lysine carboxypeptidase